MKNKEIGSQLLKDVPVLLCLTTLHHRRFLEDVVHIIGLPHGSLIRLRYRKPYVDPTLWHRVSTSFDVPKIALVALGGIDGEGKSTTVPLRTANIHKSKCEGELLIIDIALEDFAIEKPGQDFFKFLQGAAKSFPVDFLPGKSSAGTYLQTISSSSIPITTNRSVGGWEKTANAFFRVDEIPSTSDGPKSHRMPFLFYVNNLPSKIKNISGALTLEMGQRINLDVHTICRKTPNAITNPLGEVIFDISHESATFTSSRRIRIDSTRDVKSIGISSAPLFRTTEGHLSIRTNLFYVSSKDAKEAVDAEKQSDWEDIISANDRSEASIARYDFPFKVGRCWPWVASGLIAAATALSVYKVSTQGAFKEFDLAIPIFVFIFTFAGLSLGLIKK